MEHLFLREIAKGLLEGEEPRPVLWQPDPQNIPQQLAFESLADETFYGGSAGGGKSDLGEGVCIEQGRRSIMFRRHFNDLDWLETRSKEIIGTVGSFNHSKHQWKFPDGRLMCFAGLQQDKDWEKWKGNPFDTQVWDEVTEFPKLTYQALSAWNRSSDPNQRCRIISTFNPPTTAAGIWVIEYLAPWLDRKHPNPAKPGELRWFAMVDGESIEVESCEPFEHKGELIYPRSRTFIRARVTDNPYYAHNSKYIGTLQNLPEPLRSQMLYGDMEVGMQDDEWQLIPTKWLLLAQERWKEGPPEDENGVRLPLSAIGIDVARGGIDNSVLAKAYGWWVDNLEVKPGRLTPTGEDIIRWLDQHYENLDEIGVVPVGIDPVGVGASPYDFGRKAGHRIYGIDPRGASRALAKKGGFGFVNMRAEMYWALREALDPDGDIRLALPPDPLLTAELRAHLYFRGPRGIGIIEKSKIHDTIGRSPDRAEALATMNKVYGKR